jgi:hypothetical protein
MNNKSEIMWKIVELLSCSWSGQAEKNHEDLRMHSDFKAGPAKYET